MPPLKQIVNGFSSTLACWGRLRLVRERCNQNNGHIQIYNDNDNNNNHNQNNNNTTNNNNDILFVLYIYMYIYLHTYIYMCVCMTKDNHHLPDPLKLEFHIVLGSVAMTPWSNRPTF